MSKLFLSKPIFTKDKIQKAIDAYALICSIELHANNGYWVLLFKNCQYDDIETMREFENYVIGLEATDREPDENM